MDLKDFPRGMQIRPSEGVDPSFEMYGATGRDQMTHSRGVHKGYGPSREASNPLLVAFNSYAKGKGYTQKVVGDDAYSNPSTGGFLKLISTNQDGSLLVYEEGKGRYAVDVAGNAVEWEDPATVMRRRKDGTGGRVSGLMTLAAVLGADAPSSGGPRQVKEQPQADGSTRVDFPAPDGGISIGNGGDQAGGWWWSTGTGSGSDAGFSSFEEATAGAADWLRDRSVALSKESGDLVELAQRIDDQEDPMERSADVNVQIGEGDRSVLFSNDAGTFVIEGTAWGWQIRGQAGDYVVEQSKEYRGFREAGDEVAGTLRGLAKEKAAAAEQYSAAAQVVEGYQMKGLRGTNKESLPVAAGLDLTGRVHMDVNNVLKPVVAGKKAQAGWWKIDPAGGGGIDWDREQKEDLVSGDGPADVMGPAVKQIIAMYEEEWGRKPKMRELQAVLEFVIIDDLEP